MTTLLYSSVRSGLHFCSIGYSNAVGDPREFACSSLVFGIPRIVRGGIARLVQLVSASTYVKYRGS